MEKVTLIFQLKLVEDLKKGHKRSFRIEVAQHVAWRGATTEEFSDTWS